jgi:hypothetical protein
MLAYGAVSTFARWPASLAAAAAAFGASALAIQDVALTLPVAATAAAASLIVAYLLLPRPRAAAVSAKLPWWDIPARMLAAFALVTIIMLSADVLGPRLSGIVSTYPAMVTVVGAFTHRQWGLDAVRHMLRGLTLSLLVFVAFFLMVGISLPTAGLVLILAYPNLPSLEALTEYQPKIPLRVYTAEGALIGEFGEERRSLISIHWNWATKSSGSRPARTPPS